MRSRYSTAPRAGMSGNDPVQGGFTLVELMIALVVATIVIAAVYAAYTVQQHTYTVQDAVAEMQQNLRSAMMLLSRDIRMAGLDPSGGAINLGITSASRGRLSIQMDLNGDGDVDDADEKIDFGFSLAKDTDNDGIPDGGSAISLGRQSGGAGGYQPIAENIESVEFNYILDDGSATVAPGPGELNRIRSIQLSLLARASRPDRKFVNTMSYVPASGTPWASYNDNYRRRLLIATIQCRNLGM